MNKLFDIVTQQRRYKALLEKANQAYPEKYVQEIKDADGLVFATLIVDHGVVKIRKGGLELTFCPGDIEFLYKALGELLEE